MASQLPSQTLKRVRISPRTCCSKSQTQQRNASLLKRPHRPYTFTQLVTLSDGSSYLTRTTSPVPVYKSTKDTRNHALWQPSLSSLRNVEQDEAGRLRAFRQRFGRGWDLDADVKEDGEKSQEDGMDGLMDLISSMSSNSSKETSAATGSPSENARVEEEEILVTIKNAEGKLVKVKPKSDKVRKAAAAAAAKK